MTTLELRKLLHIIENALDVFQERDASEFTANETRVRLSLAAARRQALDELKGRSELE
jgi:hypothetical protein